MLELGFEVKEIVEGRARLLVPKGVGEVDPSKLPAFYNPASKISRDIAVLVTSAYFSGGDKTFAEPLAGLGARSVRLLLESGAFAEGKACDINENSARLISVNAQLNGLEGRLKAYHMDANVFLSTIAAERQKVHYVDLDPSGSPVRFLEGSLRALLPDGLLGVSATDLAALSGASPRTALWRYGLRLTRTVFRKEVALRALTAVAVMAASRLSRSAVPVFAVIHRHFARVFLKVRRGKTGAYRSVSQLGYLKYCHSCLNVERVGELLGTSERCGRCGSQASLLGPLWLGPLQDQEIVSKVLRSDLIGEETFEEARKVLVHISQEPNDVPFSYPVSELSRRARCSPVSPKLIVERLREMGYRASVAHYDHGAVKTDAPLDLLYELVRSTA